MMSSLQLNQRNTIQLVSAEISDFDPITKRLFVTGEAAGKPVLQVINASNPKSLTVLTTIDLSAIGSSIQSVAIRKGTASLDSIVAVAIAGNVQTDNGRVAFFNASTLAKLAEVEVGAMPDMLIFIPDGTKLLVANEGEPNEAFSVDPQGSISIIDVSGDISALSSSNVSKAGFSSFDSQASELRSQGVRIFGMLSNGEASTVSQDLEPEYIAVSNDGKTAFITLQENNAFGILDVATATITKVVPLGFKNHALPENALDASDRDVNGTSAGGGKINIQNLQILGMYQPDGISSFEIAGQTFYITANEGESRIRPTVSGTIGFQGSVFNEEARVSSLNLDSTAFPNATNLKNNQNAGRLTVTNRLGDTDGDGDFDELYAFGARSFSIWNDQGQLVYDSGSQIERIIAQRIPKLFNAISGNLSQFDTRSDNSGAEPESVVTGVVNGRTYGFIGLEYAASGVLVFDITNPQAPSFLQYIFIESDISTEGLEFISAAESPTGSPLLAVSNDVSNTVSLYEIGQANLEIFDFTDSPKLGTTSSGQDVFLGGFSGLYFQGRATNGNLRFVTHTDRGPVGEPTGANRPFLLPDFQPEIVSFELNQASGEIAITQRTKLLRSDGVTPLTGLPNLQPGPSGTAYNDDIPVNIDGSSLPNDPFGADLEGVVVAENGDYWMVDEYRPSIYRFDTSGKLLDRFIPLGTAQAASQPVGTFGTEALPAVYAQRRLNRGFEAIALEGNKLYAFTESALDNPDNATDSTSRNSSTIRILEFDIVTKTVAGEYLYILENITGSGVAKTDRVSDAVSLGNKRFAVIERDDRSDETANKLIFEIDLSQATNINNPGNLALVPAGKTLEQLTPAERSTAKILTARKSLIANAAQVGYSGVSQLEGLALVAPDTLALLNDNAFTSSVPSRLGILQFADSWNQGIATYQINGSPVVGQTLSAVRTASDPDGDGTPTFSWQTFAAGSWSPVGTSASYLITDADQGKPLRLNVNYIDSAGTAESITLAAGTVSLLPDLAIAALTPSQNEGSIGSTPFGFQVTRTGDLTGSSRLDWVVEGMGANPADSTDFALNQLPRGTAEFAAGQDTLTINIAVVGDGSFEADEGFRVRLNSAINGRITPENASATSLILNDDQAPPSFSFKASDTVVYEGNQVAIGITTNNVVSGTVLYWQFTGTGITATDFSPSATSGEVLIGRDGRASFTRFIAADAVVDGDETLKIRFFSDPAHSQQVGNTLSILIQEPTVGAATDGNDIITGTVAGEALSGVPSLSTVRGRGSRDELTGGAGLDIFVLGDAMGCYYDDGLSANRGTTDMAIIRDFSSGDSIRLWGTSSQYSLVPTLFNGSRGVRIDLNPLTAGALPEAIGFVQGATLASLSIANPNQFNFIIA